MRRSFTKVTSSVVTMAMIMASFPAFAFADDTDVNIADTYAVIDEEIAEETEQDNNTDNVEYGTEDDAGSAVEDESGTEEASAAIQVYNAGNDDVSIIEVRTWKELNDAINNNETVSVLLQDDIYSSGGTANSDYITIKYPYDVTIDLNGHTLSRNLNNPSYNGYLFYVNGNLTINDSVGTGKLTGGNNTMVSPSSGGCIYITEKGKAVLNNVKVDGNITSNDGFGGAVYNQGTLTINGGSLTNNTAGEGGAIYNAKDANATLVGVTITGNTSTKHGGGAIDNYGTLNIKNTTITDNKCLNSGSGNNGAGIWQGGTLNIEGKIVIKDNTSNGGAPNLFLKNGKTINVQGHIDPESVIKLKCENYYSKYFTNWQEGDSLDVINIEENGVYPGLYGNDVRIRVRYNDRIWDDTYKVIRNDEKVLGTQSPDVQPRELNTTPGSGWYYAYKTQSFGDRISLQSGATVNIVLGSNAHVNCTKGIYVPAGSTLNIYAEGLYEGKLTATGDSDNAAIGGNGDSTVGNINIYSGTIVATGGKFASGIGAGNNSKYIGNITIDGGDITAKSPKNGAGIGGGYDETITSGSIRIRSGYVNAEGGSDTSTFSGAGIGAGGGSNLGKDVTITISGGTVTALSGSHDKAVGAAGIGGGSYNDGGGDMAGKILIEGGEVTATGGGKNAYVGVEGDHVCGGAGIGGGFGGNITETGSITITGGNVTAFGKYGGASIGAGAESYSIGDFGAGGECEGKITIKGGTCTLKHDGKGEQFIGHGYIGSEEGELSLGEVSVHFDGESVAGRNARAGLCRQIANKTLIIEKCEHSNTSYVNKTQNSHTVICEHCSYSVTEDHVFDSQQHCTVCGYSHVGTIYKVTIHDIDGNPPTSETVVPDSQYLLPDYSRTLPSGKIFKCWMVTIGNTSTGNGKEYAPGESFRVTDNSHIFPVFDEYSHLEGYSLSLEGDIGVNFYMSMSDNLAQNDNTYVHFELPHGRSTNVSIREAVTKKVEVNGQEYNYYVFKCNVAAKDISSVITAQLNSGNYRGDVYDFTVRDYAEYLLDPEHNHPDYVAAAPLVKAMLNYGTCAQLYFNVNTDEPANRSLSKDDKDVINTVPDISISDPVDALTDGVTIHGVSISLKSETSMSFYFRSDEDLTFDCDGYTVLKDTSGDYQVARIIGIHAKDIGRSFTLTVGSHGSYTYSPLNYCQKIVTGTYSDDLKNVVIAFYRYYEAASSYYSSNQN